MLIKYCEDNSECYLYALGLDLREMLTAEREHPGLKRIMLGCDSDTSPAAATKRRCHKQKRRVPQSVPQKDVLSSVGATAVLSSLGATAGNPIVLSAMDGAVCNPVYLD